MERMRQGMLRHWLLALALLLICAGARAQVDDRARLEAFLDVTGFGVSLDSIALSARDAPLMLGMSASDFGTQWATTSEEVFAQEIVHGLALDMLSQTLSDDLLIAAATFYASPLGQRLVIAENASHMVEQGDTKQADGAALIEDAPPERIALLRRLTDAVDTAGIAIGAIREVQVRFLVAASAAGILERELDEATLRAVLSAGDDALRETLQVVGMQNAAYTYQEFSNDEIAAYADALESDAMQQVYELMNAVQFEIMANRFEALALRMADLHPGQSL